MGTTVFDLLKTANNLLAHAGHVEELGCVNAAIHMRDAAEFLEIVATIVEQQGRNAHG